MSSKLIAILATLCIFVLPSTTAQTCFLCGDPFPSNLWYNHVVGSGKTCKDLIIDLGPEQGGSSKCQSTINSYSRECCSGSAPPPPAPSPAPVYNGPVGNEKVCNVCAAGQYPGKPKTMISARYVGFYSCEQLYDRGLARLIPSFMCGPLTDYTSGASGACACAPSGGSSSAQAPRPAPVPAPRPAPVPYVQPTAYNRKSPPNNDKNLKKLGNRRGGAAGGARLRRGLQEEEIKRVPEEIAVEELSSRS